LVRQGAVEGGREIEEEEEEFRAKLAKLVRHGAKEKKEKRIRN
jgi:hypothetical protein